MPDTGCRTPDGAATAVSQATASPAPITGAESRTSGMLTRLRPLAAGEVDDGGHLR